MAREGEEGMGKADRIGRKWWGSKGGWRPLIHISGSASAISPFLRCECPMNQHKIHSDTVVSLSLAHTSPLIQVAVAIVCRAVVVINDRDSRHESTSWSHWFSDGMIDCGVRGRDQLCLSR